ALIDQALGRAGELRADGGVSAHDSLMQLQADLLGRPVRRMASTEGSAIGAALLAGIAAGQRDEAEMSRADAGTLFLPVADDQWRDRALARWHDALGRARFSPLSA